LSTHVGQLHYGIQQNSRRINQQSESNNLNPTDKRRQTIADDCFKINSYY
jgi:hypothetical protein